MERNHSVALRAMFHRTVRYKATQLQTENGNNPSSFGDFVFR